VKKNKVIAQLMALPPKEFRRFGKFVRNPANNKKDTLIRLYQFVVNNHPEYEERKFNKAQCLLYVFPELEYQYERLNGKADEFVSKKLKNPLYEFKNLIEEFIIQQELAVRSHEKTMLLIKGLFKRQMHDKAFQLIDKELKSLEGMVGDDYYHHFYQFQLLELKQDHVLDKVKINPHIYTNLINNLDLFYLDSRLRFECIIKDRKENFDNLYNNLFAKDIKSLVENYEIEKMTPTIKLYSKLIVLSDSANIEEFSETKHYFYNNVNDFSLSNKNDFGIYLFNYCNYKSKKGEKDFLKQAFELRRFALEKRIIFENGFLKPIDFTNLIVMSTTLKEFDWTFEFIEQYAKYLPDERRQSIVGISKAQIEAEKPDGDFKKVIELLRDVVYFNVYDNMQARSIMLRAYYRLKEWQTLSYFLESFYKFIDRNTTIGLDYKLSCKNMIKFTRILMNAQHKTVSKSSLIKKLDSLNPIVAKKWLTNRINEMFEK